MPEGHTPAFDATRALAAAHVRLERLFACGAGMYTTDSAALLAIIDAEEHGAPLTPTRLTKSTGLTAAGTSMLLNRLRDSGQILREKDQPDRRLVTLHSTASPHEASQAFYKPLNLSIDAIIEEYSLEELQLIERYVTRLRMTIDLYRESVLSQAPYSRIRHCQSRCPDR